MLSGAAAIAKVVVKAEAREDNWIVQEVGWGPQFFLNDLKSLRVFIDLQSIQAGPK